MIGLHEDVLEMFALLEGVFETEAGSLPHGFHAHEHLTQARLTTREAMTPEQRKAKRKALEVARRGYKTAKQREYAAKKRAA